MFQEEQTEYLQCPKCKSIVKRKDIVGVEVNNKGMAAFFMPKKKELLCQICINKHNLKVKGELKDE